MKSGLNFEYNGRQIKDVATKVLGKLFGENGRAIGEKVDEKTKKLTIKIEK